MHSVFFPDSFLASFLRILRFPQIYSDSAKHTSKLNHSRARLICSGIILQNLKSGRNLGGRTLESSAYCATCNKHTAGRLKYHKTAGVNDATVPRCKPLCCAAIMPFCRHYCHCVSRGSIDGADMAVCGGGSSSSCGCGSSSGGGCGIGSGAILLLVCCHPPTPPSSPH